MRTFLAAVFAVSLLGFSSNGFAIPFEQIPKKVDCSSKKVLTTGTFDEKEEWVDQTYYSNWLSNFYLNSQFYDVEWSEYEVRLRMALGLVNYYWLIKETCGLDFPGYK